MKTFPLDLLAFGFSKYICTSPGKYFSTFLSNVDIAVSPTVVPDGANALDRKTTDAKKMKGTSSSSKSHGVEPEQRSISNSTPSKASGRASNAEQVRAKDPPVMDVKKAHSQRSATDTSAAAPKDKDVQGKVPADMKAVHPKGATSDSKSKASLTKHVPDQKLGTLMIKEEWMTDVKPEALKTVREARTWDMSKPSSEGGTAAGARSPEGAMPTASKSKCSANKVGSEEATNSKPPSTINAKTECSEAKGSVKQDRRSALSGSAESGGKASSGSAVGMTAASTLAEEGTRETADLGFFIDIMPDSNLQRIAASEAKSRAKEASPVTTSAEAPSRGKGHPKHAVRGTHPMAKKTPSSSSSNPPLSQGSNLKYSSRADAEKGPGGESAAGVTRQGGDEATKRSRDRGPDRGDASIASGASATGEKRPGVVENACKGGSAFQERSSRGAMAAAAAPGSTATMPVPNTVAKMPPPPAKTNVSRKITPRLPEVAASGGRASTSQTPIAVGTKVSF